MTFQLKQDEIKASIIPLGVIPLSNFLTKVNKKIFKKFYISFSLLLFLCLSDVFLDPFSFITYLSFHYILTVRALALALHSSIQLP